MNFDRVGNVGEGADLFFLPTVEGEGGMVAEANRAY